MKVYYGKRLRCVAKLLTEPVPCVIIVLQDRRNFFFWRTIRIKYVRTVDSPGEPFIIFTLKYGEMVIQNFKTGTKAIELMNDMIFDHNREQLEYKRAKRQYIKNLKEML